MKSFLLKLNQLRLSHSVLVGALATFVDLGTLALLVQGMGLSPSQANIPSLTLGSLIQFFGHRHFVFKAWDGKLSRQALLFALTEFAGVGLNAVAFHFLVQLTPIHYAAARPIGGAVVYLGFSFPLWRWIFRDRTSTGSQLSSIASANSAFVEKSS